MGLMLGPANTDAINRAPGTSYGEATGITQTVRNYGSSLGHGGARHHPDHPEQGPTSRRRSAGSGCPRREADAIAQSLSQSGGGNSTQLRRRVGPGPEIFKAVQLDFAQSSQVVFYHVGRDGARGGGCAGGPAARPPGRRRRSQRLTPRQPAAASTFATSSKHSGEMPPASWSTMSIVTVFHEFDQSGWWFIFSAASATRVMSSKTQTVPSSGEGRTYCY